MDWKYYQVQDDSATFGKFLAYDTSNLEYWNLFFLKGFGA
jgi:hypothetical protein